MLASNVFAVGAFVKKLAAKFAGSSILSVDLNDDRKLRVERSAGPFSTFVVSSELPTGLPTGCCIATSFVGLRHGLWIRREPCPCSHSHPSQLELTKISIDLTGFSHLKPADGVGTDTHLSPN